VAGGDGAVPGTLMSRSRLFRQSSLDSMSARCGDPGLRAVDQADRMTLAIMARVWLVLRDLLARFLHRSICVTWRRRVTRSSRRVRFSGLFSHNRAWPSCANVASVAAVDLVGLGQLPKRRGKVTRLTRIDHSDVEAGIG